MEFGLLAMEPQKINVDGAMLVTKRPMRKRHIEVYNGGAAGFAKCGRQGRRLGMWRLVSPGKTTDG